MSQQSKTTKSSKFRAITLVVFALIIGVLGYAILFQGRAAVPPAPTMYLTPETVTIAPNTTFTVTVRENSGTVPTSGVQADFTYPANLVDFVGIDSTASPFTSQVKASGASGQVSIVRAQLEPPFLTGDQLVAVVTFKAKAAVNGTSNMAFNLDTGIINTTNNTELLGSLSRTQGTALTIDGQAPAASVTAPANGASISSGSTTPITVTATDNTGVSSVEIYVDNALKTTLSTAPYTYNWNTTGLALGNHTVHAIAKDAYGNSSPASSITVSIADKTAPTVSLSAPTAGSIVRGSIPVSATATDNPGGTGVNRVEFYAGSTMIGQDTTSPYSITWNTASMSDGAQSITARAYDNASPANMNPSAAVNITIENTDRTAPTTPGNLRVTSTGLNTASLAWNASTDNIAVTGYRVSRNGGAPTTVTTLTFNDTGLTAGTTYNYSVVAIDAAGNASTAATVTASTPAVKIGDFNQDDKVDLVDLGIMINRWGSADTTCDLNKNGKVDLIDLAIYISNYGK